MRSILLLTLPAILIACAPSMSSSRGQRQPLPNPVVVSIDEAVPSATPVTRPHTDPTVVNPCEVATTNAGTTDQRWALQLNEGDDRWGTLATQAGEVSLKIQQGKLRGSLAYEFFGAAITIAGWVETSTVQLYPKQPQWVSEVLLLDASQPLRWSGVDGERVRIDVTLPTRITNTLRLNDTVEHVVPCADVGLVRRAYDAKRMLSLDGFEDGEIAGAEPIELRAKPDGEVKMTLAPSNGRDVLRGPIVGKWQQMIVHGRHSHIRAWVPKRRLRALNGNGGGGGWGGGRGRGSHTVNHTVDHRCDNNLPLFVSSESQLVEIGLVNAGVVFQVAPLSKRPNAMTQVHFLKRDAVSLAKGTEWQVRTQAIQRCRL